MSSEEMPEKQPFHPVILKNPIGKMFHRTYRCLSFLFIYTLVESTVETESVGSAQPDRMVGNSGNLLRQLESSGSVTVYGGIENVWNIIEPTPLLTEESMTPSSYGLKTVMTVTATRIGTDGYFHPGPSYSISSSPPSIVYSSSSESIDKSTHSEADMSVETPTVLPQTKTTVQRLGDDMNNNSLESEKKSPASDYSGQFIESIFSSRMSPKKIILDYIKNTSDDREIEDPHYHGVVRESPYERDIAAALSSINSHLDSTTSNQTMSNGENNLRDKTENFLEYSQSAIDLNVTTFPRDFVKVKESNNAVVADAEEDADVNQLNYFEQDDFPVLSGEDLPSPGALISMGVEPYELKDEFSEALKPNDPGLNPRRRRIRPGPYVNRKMRMRVRKVNMDSTTPIGDIRLNQVNLTTAAPQVIRRYRSTTTTPPTLIQPDPSPPTILPKSRNNYIVENNGTYPISLEDVVTPEPQLERPLNIFTEQISTYRIPYQYISTSKPSSRQTVNESGGNKTIQSEWLHSSNSKQHNLQLDVVNHEPFVKERDRWEKDYMQLQQNSFYRTSPEVMSGEETLRSLNRNKEKNFSTSSVFVAPHPPQLSKNEILVLSKHTSDEIHHRYFSKNRYGQFILREDNSGGVDEVSSHNQNKMKIIEVTTSEPPESVLIRHSDPELEYLTESVRGQMGVTMETKKLELIPVAAVGENSQGYYSQQFVPSRPYKTLQSIIYHNNEPPLEEPHQQSHYDRTKHRLNKLPSIHQSSEIIHDQSLVIGSIKDNRRNRPTKQKNTAYVVISSRGLPQAQPIQIHHFNSHEFLGFGGDKHFNPEQLHKRRMSGSHLFMPKSQQHDFTEIGINSAGEDHRKSNRNKENTKNPFYAKSITTLPTPLPQTHIVISGDLSPFHDVELLGTQQQQGNFSTNIEKQLYHKSIPHFLPYSQQIYNQISRSESIPDELSKLGSSKVKDHSQFESVKTGPSSYHKLQDTIMNNMIQSFHPKTQPNRGGPNGNQFAKSAHTPQFFFNDRKLDLIKSGDFSKAHPNLSGTTPSITLPMPGLVSIPTPPPESHALSQVYSNRHYPPHTHSMSVNPDYEPANPPLLKGHPLEYHFDPFIQNAGDYPEDKHTVSGKIIPLTKFRNSQPPDQNVPGQGSPHVSSQPPTYNEYDDDVSVYSSPQPKKKQKPKSRNRYPKLIETSQKVKEVYGGDQSEEYTSDYRNQFQNFNAERSRGQEMSNNLSPGDLHSLHLSESKEIRHNVKPSPHHITQQREHLEGQSQKGESIFSDNAYVLMFPTMVSESAMLPAKPNINGKEIPVLSASDPAFFEKTMGRISPFGYQPVKVHPREQMLQVLATNHYDMEMEKYMEKKRQAPLPIHTPYGLLVPMGQPNSITFPSTGHSHYHHLESHSNNYNSGSNIPLTKLEDNHGRRKKIKDSLDPAIDDLAEKLAYRISGFDHILDVEAINHPPRFLGIVEHSNNIPYETQQMSFSEHKPVKASNLMRPEYVIPMAKENKKSNAELKVAMKALLRQRLEEMLVEIEEEEKMSKKLKKMRKEKKRSDSNLIQMASTTLYKFLPTPLPLEQGMRPPHGPPSQEQGGIIQSIKRFFSFGRQSEANLTKFIYPPHPQPYLQQPLRTNNLTNIHWAQKITKNRGLDGILKKRSPLGPDSLKKSQLNERDGQELEDVNWTKEENPNTEENRPMTKLLKLLFKAAAYSTTTTPNPITNYLNHAHDRSTVTTNKLLLKNIKSFSPSRSMEEMKWTPLPFDINQSRGQQKPEEVEDQLQAETETTG